MLRASSLGLSFPLPTIFTVQACRRLCGVRNKRIQMLNTTNASSSTSTEKAHQFSSAGAHQQPDGERGENIRAVDALENFRVGSIVPTSHIRTTSATTVEDDGGQTVPATTAPSTLPSEVLEHMKNIVSEENLETLLGRQEGAALEPLQSVITEPRSFAAGRPWAMKDVKPAFFAALGKHLQGIKEDIDVEQLSRVGVPLRKETLDGDEQPPTYQIISLIRNYIQILGESQSAEEAWHAYVCLIDYISKVPAVQRNLPYIPYSHLHRLCRLLARNRPKTHHQFLRLLAVMTYIKHCGGRILQHEYNSLVDHAGQGWRRTTKDEVTHALSVLRSLEMGQLPDQTDGAMPEQETGEQMNKEQIFEPDVYTYTSLLSIAARAMDTTELLNISSLMAKAGIPPNRITHLALLQYFIKKGNLGGVRSTLQKMRSQQLEVGLDGLNACMWAYARNKRVDVAVMIYRLLRHNTVPETYVGQGDIHDTTSQLAEEYIFVEPDVRPNEATYAIFIQVMAYHGQFHGVLNGFTDMLSSENIEEGAPLYLDDSGQPKPAPYNPSIATFRSIFIGFSKFGVPPEHVVDDDSEDWTLENLGNIFERFLCLPQDSVVTYGMIDIIMKAFVVTSGWNIDLMRNVWTAIEQRFNPVAMRAVKKPSENRLMQLKMKLFPE